MAAPMEPDVVRAGMDDPQRIEAARRVLAEAPGEAVDRLAVAECAVAGHCPRAGLDLHRRAGPADAARPAPPARRRAVRADVRRPARPEPQAPIAAYLGTTIEIDGLRIGVLCVYDAEHVEWTAHDRDVLRELARAIAAELERGALAAELESSTVRLDLGFAAANIGSFDWNLTTNALHLDDRLMELFGYDAAQYVPHIDSFSARLHPEDRARTDAAIAQAIERCGEYTADYRVVHPNGDVRWVAARGRVLCDEQGQPTRMLGAAYDTTLVHDSAEHLGRVLETMSTAFLTLDHGWRFAYMNAAAERILGRTRAELVGRVIWDEFPEAVGTESDTNYRAAMDENRAVSFQQFFPPLETWFDVRATPTGDGISVYFHDITDRVRAEQDLARLAGEREDALAASGAATGRLQILSAASARFAGTLEVDELLEIISDVILNGFGDGVVLALAESVRREDGTGEGFTIARVVPSARDAGVVAHPSLTGSRVDASALSAARELRAAELAEPLGDRPALALPLVSRGRTLGAIVVLDPVTSELDLLVELAARAGAALDNAVLYAAERRLALTLQRSLLPVGLPELPGIELAARYLPGTGGRDVGGDFYLAHPLADGRLLLVIGDVMGHGAQAAARMGQLRAVVAAYAYDGDPPDRVLAHLSIRASALLDLPMATVIAAVYDPASRRLTFALAGHLPPLDRSRRRARGVRRRPARPAAGRRGHRLRAARGRAPARGRGGALHRRADRGPHAPDRRRAGAVARRARGHPAGAGRDLRPRARGAWALAGADDDIALLVLRH